MGYTHYWALDPEAAGVDEGFARTAADTARIIAAAGIPLAADSEESTQPPQLTSEVIWLNGIGEDGHEPFVLRRHPARAAADWQAQQAAELGYWWNSCKTNWKPYDLVVCAILIRAHQHLPDAFVFDSDGHWNDPCWRARRTSSPASSDPTPSLSKTRCATPSTPSHRQSPDAPSHRPSPTGAGSKQPARCPTPRTPSLPPGERGARAA